MLLQVSIAFANFAVHMQIKCILRNTRPFKVKPKNHGKLLLDYFTQQRDVDVIFVCWTIQQYVYQQQMQMQMAPKWITL